MDCRADCQLSIPSAVCVFISNILAFQGRADWFCMLHSVISFRRWGQAGSLRDFLNRGQLLGDGGESCQGRTVVAIKALCIPLVREDYFWPRGFKFRVGEHYILNILGHLFWKSWYIMTFPGVSILIQKTNTNCKEKQRCSYSYNFYLSRHKHIIGKIDTVLAWQLLYLI